MNKHVPLRASGMFGPNLKLVPATEADVELAAYALHHAALILRSTPKLPQVQYLYDGRRKQYEAALADMKQVLENV